MNHKSTTHQEEYFHINDDFFTILGGEVVHLGTVFARKEADGWYATASFVHDKDQFCRRIGRQVARRRYFTDPNKRVKIEGDDRLTYSDAQDVFDTLYESSFPMWSR